MILAQGGDCCFGEPMSQTDQIKIETRRDALIVVEVYSSLSRSLFHEGSLWTHFAKEFLPQITAALGDETIGCIVEKTRGAGGPPEIAALPSRSDLPAIPNPDPRGRKGPGQKRKRVARSKRDPKHRSPTRKFNLQGGDPGTPETHEDASREANAEKSKELPTSIHGLAPIAALRASRAIRRAVSIAEIATFMKRQYWEVMERDKHKDPHLIISVGLSANCVGKDGHEILIQRAGRGFYEPKGGFPKTEAAGG